MEIINHQTTVTPELLKKIADTPDSGGTVTDRVYEWELKIKVSMSNIWVMDGFEATEERIKDALEDMLCDHMAEGEYMIDVEMMNEPPQEAIRVEQGHPVPGSPQ